MVASFAFALFASLHCFGDAIDLDTDGCVASDKCEKPSTITSAMMQKGMPPRMVCEGVSSEFDETCAKETDMKSCRKRSDCSVSRDWWHPPQDASGWCEGQTDRYEDICRDRDERYCRGNKDCVWKAKKPKTKM
eukprot:TRINITY_DN50389_c0_g1_i1.p1 TRINITY_DN50389_c0_g1~~TRINITY_DN50389_c0_g1_i1.p1  ORF type:complete len:152 (-),score=20.02 TRINITY_DN50389_c0_g1_i1:207-608(-)